MPPAWLTNLSWVAAAVAVFSAGWILADLYLFRHRQSMRVMEAVWPITALYLGPLAVWGYRRFGVTKSPRWQEKHGLTRPLPAPRWSSIAVGISHCGAGCTLGDVLAEWCVFASGATVLGLALVPEYVGDYAAALLLGIVFQYFAIAPMRSLGLRDGLRTAAKADFLSLSAFELGLFGWMALTRLVLFPAPHLRPTQISYWFLMAIGMELGFLTAWPANAWLIRRGVKEAM